MLEIGTGVGSLTTRLSDQAGAVLSVEIDANLHQLAGEELEGRHERATDSRRRSPQQEYAAARIDGTGP